MLHSRCLQSLLPPLPSSQTSQTSTNQERVEGEKEPVSLRQWVVGTRACSSIDPALKDQFHGTVHQEALRINSGFDLAWSSAWKILIWSFITTSWGQQSGTWMQEARSNALHWNKRSACFLSPAPLLLWVFPSKWWYTLHVSNWWKAGGGMTSPQPAFPLRKFNRA